MKGRQAGAKDKSQRSRSPKGTHKTGEMATRFHDDVKARHAGYPPAGAVHMNSGMPPQAVPIPNAMDSAGGMPQGNDMTNSQGGGEY